MSGGGGGGDTTTVQKADPWVGQQPHLLGLYGDARNLPLQEAYPDSTVAPFSEESLSAQAIQKERALGGSPVLEAGQEATRATAAGDYLYGGEGFNRAYEAAERRITPEISGAFSGAGRYGSGLHQESLSRGLGDAFAGLYGKERGLQMSASAMSPGLASADYQDIQALSQVGAQKESKQQQNINDLVRQWEFAQAAPYQRLQAQSGVIQGGFPGSQTVSDTQSSGGGPSVLGGAASGAMTGAAMGSIVPGIGTGMGAVAGGAMGGIGAAMK